MESFTTDLDKSQWDWTAMILAAMHNEFIPERGLRMTGKHHEIYFNDFRKVEAFKLRTILRQPVEKALEL